jgi:hypothetical protein
MRVKGRKDMAVPPGRAFVISLLKEPRYRRKSLDLPVLAQA